MTVSCWQILKIEPTRDQRVIKKAYAGLLKQIDQNTNALGFQQLREAYEQALNIAKYVDDDDEEAYEDVTPANGEEIPAALQITDTHDQDSSQYLIRTEPPRRAAQDIAIDDIFNSLNELGENIAIEKLKIHTSLADFQSIDARTDLECALLKQFYQLEKFPLELAKAAALVFGWDAEKNPFKYDHQVAYFYEHVVNQIAYLGAVSHVTMQCFPDPRQRDKTVEDVIFAQFDEQGLTDIVANEARRNTANRIISYMMNEYKLFPALPVDPETVTWWRKNVYGENTEVVAPQETKKKSGTSYWVVWVLIIVLFNVVGQCSRGSSSNTHKTTQKNYNMNKDGQSSAYKDFLKADEKSKQRERERESPNQ